MGEPARQWTEERVSGRYQLFERTGARLFSDGRIEWLRTDEVEALRKVL